MATIQELEDFKLSDAIKFHNKLNPNLWVNDKLDPEVREQLLLVADDFITTLGISDLHVMDITVSGSNAAYSYTPHSDLDLHIVVDMSKLANDEIYRELFTAKKTLYNDSHDISVHGVPVEVYVQDSNEPVKSLGEYSVLNDKWIRIPKKTRANFDQAATKAKFDNLAEIVELAVKTKNLERIEKTISTIKRYRKAGLDKGGEFSPENLAFKAIRKQGGIQDLYNMRDSLRSKKLSIEESTTRDDALIKIKKLLNTTGRTPAEKETIKNIVDKMMKQWNIKPEEIGIYQRVDPLKAKIAKAQYEKQMAAAAMGDEWNRFKRGIFAENELNEYAKDEDDTLVETTQESQLVNLISKRASKEIYKMMRKKESALANIIAPDMKRHKLEIGGISADKLGVPYTNDPVLSKVLNNAKIKAYNFIDPTNRRLAASYDSVSHDITVYYPTIVRDALKQEYEIVDYLAKIISHELQHAVDNFKSKGKTFDTNKTSYMTLPYEINARFQEALMNITLVIDDAKKNGKIPNRKFLPTFIDAAFNHNNITQYLPKDGKRYKRLASRAYKFFDAELNNPKKEQPFSIVKRAMNYILDKPTGTVNEASGYIPSAKEKNDPRFKTALTVDVKPDSIKKNAKAFNWKTSRAGIPPQANPNGKIAEDLMNEWKSFLAEDEQLPEWKFKKCTLKESELRRFFEQEAIERRQTYGTRIVYHLGDNLAWLERVDENTVSPKIKELLDFQNSITRYDQRSKVKPEVGNTLSIVQVRPHTAENIIELRGFLNPKTITDVVYDNEYIAWLEFDDGSSFPDKTLYKTGRGNDFERLVTLMFPDKAAAEGALAFIYLQKPEGWEIGRASLGENASSQSDAFFFGKSKTSTLKEDQEQQELFPGYDEQHREKRLGNWLAKSWGVQNGKPQTFYHATTKDFDTFNTHGTGFASALGMAYEVERHGSFFAVDPKFAEGFIEDPNTGRVKEGGRVLPVHLSIQSAIDLRDDALSRMLSDEETREEFKANDIDLNSIYNHMYELERWELFDGPEGAEFIENLQKLGFDGAIINESIPNDSNAKSGQVWVAFSPNQVKSIHNRGSFSPDDNRLMREDQKNAVPKIGYHVTATKNLPIIQKNGIKADKRGNSYIWDSREMAEWFMDFQNDEGQDRTILKIDMSGLDANPDPEAEDMSEWSSRFKPGTNGGAWIISGPIPSDKIIG